MDVRVVAPLSTVVFSRVMLMCGKSNYDDHGIVLITQFKATFMAAVQKRVPTESKLLCGATTCAKNWFAVLFEEILYILTYSWIWEYLVLSTSFKGTEVFTLTRADCSL